jgi:GntR family transcriptional regulator
MLQDEALVEKQRGKGLFVKLGVRELVMEREKQRFLVQEWPLVLEQIKRLELSPDELLASDAIASGLAKSDRPQEEQAR